MDQAKRLKLAAVAFSVFWIGGMLWWSGELHPANIVILTVCGAVGGYLWYLAMLWMFQAGGPFIRLMTTAAAGSETP